MSYHKVTNIQNNIKANNLKISFVSPSVPNNFINTTIKQILNKVKKNIEKNGDEWNNVKKTTNPYEYIHTQIPYSKTSVSKIKPLSRAFFKLIEIYKTFNLLDECGNKPIKTFHLAEGPGGFIEAVTYLRFNKFDKYYGMTLIDDSNNEIPGWKKSEEFLQKNKNVIIETGKDNTGNLYNPENYEYCLKKYRNSMDFITGDGGFDFSVNYNNQETIALRLIITQIAYAMAMQSQGGTFVLKVFDQFTHGSIDILYLLSSFYTQTYIFKPDTSRIANSERYIICKVFNVPDSNDIYDKFSAIIRELDNKNFNDCNLHRILDIDINYFFVKNIEEINAILCQKQISNILTTLQIIQNKEKRGEKPNTIKNKNIKKCIQWCVKHNIPHYKCGASSNIFMGNKQTNYFGNR
jgi:23S rRNA U2552 (ribose-2'-O)-methylase RlmE/FtsJ